MPCAEYTASPRDTNRTSCTMQATAIHPRAAGLQRTLGLVLTLLLIGLTPSALAQAVGTLTGRVTDANTRAFLAGVEVRVADSSLRTSTDASGQFAFRNLAPGEYNVIFSYLGYGSVTQSVAVAAGETARLDINMGDEVILLEDFTVRGFVEGRARALNNERAPSTSWTSSPRTPSVSSRTSRLPTPSGASPGSPSSAAKAMVKAAT
jgi:hypothetical protein